MSSLNFENHVKLLMTSQNLLDTLVDIFKYDHINKIYVSKDLYVYMENSLQADILAYNGFNIIVDYDRKDVEYGYTLKSELKSTIDSFFND